MGMENYVLVALDQRAHAYFTRLGVPSFFSAALGQDAESSQHHKSPQFRDIMHIRLVCVLALLRGGLDVWLTDVDAVFNSDPFPFVSASTLGTHSSALAYDTPFLPKGRCTIFTPIQLHSGCARRRGLGRTAARCNAPKLPRAIRLPSRNEGKNGLTITLG